MTYCSPKSINISITIGIVLAIVGIIGVVVYPKIIDGKIKDQAALINGTESFKRWEHVDVPVFFKVYVFNVTNAEDVLSNKAKKLQVEEVGPFVFQEIKKKVNISLDGDESITYTPSNEFHFLQDMTDRSMDEKVTIVNPSLLIALSLPKVLRRRNQMGQSKIFESMLKGGLLAKNDATLFETRSIKEILFDGYTNKLYKVLYDLDKKHVPEKFSFLADKNGTADDGEWEILTGRPDIQKLAQIKTWNNMTELPFWNYGNDTHLCKEIKGTDGSMYSPSVQESSTLYAFVPDLCRTVYFKFIGNDEVKGVSTMKFAIPEDFYGSAFKKEENMCFCTKDGEDIESCMNDGVMDVSLCKASAAPVLMSPPHFWMAPNYTLHIDGLKPDITKHQTVIHVEPWTGAVVKAARRLMVSFEAKHDPIAKYTELTNVEALKEKVAIPMIWVEESAELDNPNKQKLDDLLFTNVRLMKALTVTIAIIGLMVAVIGIVMHFIVVRRMGSLTFL